MKFRFPALGETEYSALYDNQLESIWPLDEKRNDWRLILAFLDDHKAEQADVLDFGCYTGQLLARLDPRHERFGVEVNEAAAAVARSTNRAAVWRDLDDVPSDRKFDVIIAMDTIEHFTDPLRILSRLLDKLKDGGILLITTGDAECTHWNRLRSNWWYCAFPEHVAFISERWLRFFSGRLGYSILECRKFRYGRMNPARRLFGYAAIYAYGVSPEGYQFARKMVRVATGRAVSNSIPGASVATDHFLAALTRRKS